MRGLFLSRRLGVTIGMWKKEAARGGYNENIFFDSSLTWRWRSPLLSSQSPMVRIPVILTEEIIFWKFFQNFEYLQFLGNYHCWKTSGFFKISIFGSSGKFRFLKISPFRNFHFWENFNFWKNLIFEIVQFGKCSIFENFELRKLNFWNKNTF